MVPAVAHNARQRWQKAAASTHKLMLTLLTRAGNARLGLDTTDPFVALIIHGGYLYFDGNKQVCGATAIVDRGESDALLQFNEGISLTAVESEAVVLEFQHRFADCTLPFMTSKGGWRYAWVLPGEQVTARHMNRYGGFLYEFAPATNLNCRFFPVLSAKGD
eukprot:gene21622-33805_t